MEVADDGRGRDGGLLSFEFLAVLPVVLLVTLFVVQAGAAVSGVLGANGAARAAALADVRGADPVEAARGALPDWLEAGMRVTSPTPGSATVQVEVPMMTAVMTGPIVVSRTVTLAPGN